MLLFLKKTCNKGVLFASVSVLSGFQQLHGMHYWDESRTVCLHKLLFFWICSTQTVFPRRNFFFIYCFLDWSLMESVQEIFSGEASTRQNHLVTDPSHCSWPISLSFSPSLSFILHPSHLPPVCQNLHNRASIFLLHHPISPLAWSFHPFSSPLLPPC